MTKLFSPIKIKDVELKNRIVMSPMCMYSCSAEDGKVTPFHQTHYASRAMGQVGLVMLEATAVQAEGRISAQDLGLWSDEQIEGLKQLNEHIHFAGAKSGIQLAHAGRKARVEPPIYAPSALAFSEEMNVPEAMTEKDIQDTVAAFQQGAKRSKIAGFDVIEIHAAHGYLLNSFLSPLTNKRTDAYGGTKENRFRLLREVIEAIKTVWSGPLFVRISAEEYAEGGTSKEDIAYFAKEMKKLDVDLIDCSSGGVVRTKINTYPGYQMKGSEWVKSSADILTGAVGLISTGIQAEEILQNERADLVFIGRALLRDPYWAKHAAKELQTNITIPKQYERGWKV